MIKSKVDVSIIVCSYDDNVYSRMLNRCINRLINQKTIYKYEIVVVVEGNNVTSKIDLLKRNDQKNNLRFYASKNRLGIGLARKIGVEIAKGNFIAFTDDDCVVDRNWIKHLVEAFQNNDIAVVGGPNFLLHPELFPNQHICKEHFQ